MYACINVNFVGFKRRKFRFFDDLSTDFIEPPCFHSHTSTRSPTTTTNTHTNITTLVRGNGLHRGQTDRINICPAARRSRVKFVFVAINIRQSLSRRTRRGYSSGKESPPYRPWNPTLGLARKSRRPKGSISKPPRFRPAPLWRPITRPPWSPAAFYRECILLITSVCMMFVHLSRGFSLVYRMTAGRRERKQEHTRPADNPTCCLSGSKISSCEFCASSAYRVQILEANVVNDARSLTLCVYILVLPRRAHRQGTEMFFELVYGV
ncbi:hypothetical protein GGR56DRAFT_469069 [Xylariaceae sp. FL0804]|nr:hypothetical protein GGR56DRAFT_469069 [Xylariaceae sp. FL0804]